MSSHGFFQITQKAFIRKGDKLLVMRDYKSGEGDLPGGRMNQDEFFDDWLDSLKRELAEELGESFRINLKEDIILVHKHRVNLGNHPCVILGYHADYISGDIKISDEHDYFDWVDIKTYKPEVLFSEFMLEAVKQYIKKYS
ncbi:MAG: NUDIX domain-containing protein [Leptospiraceae bacterium]|nr:NUDIX domain-containing protein [Leptospiraceae bacterium]